MDDRQPVAVSAFVRPSHGGSLAGIQIEQERVDPAIDCTGAYGPIYGANDVVAHADNPATDKPLGAAF
jgi:hypothetical protein